MLQRAPSVGCACRWRCWLENELNRQRGGCCHHPQPSSQIANEDRFSWSSSLLRIFSALFRGAELENGSKHAYKSESGSLRLGFGPFSNAGPRRQCFARHGTLGFRRCHERLAATDFLLYVARLNANATPYLLEKTSVMSV